MTGSLFYFLLLMRAQKNPLQGIGESIFGNEELLQVKFIADRADRSDQRRVMWIVLECPPQPANVNI